MSTTTSKRLPRVPSYRKHKATGQAVVTLDGRDYYLGKYGSAASRQEYNRLIAEWTAGGGSLAKAQGADLTIAELLNAFCKHSRGYHSKSEQQNFKLAMRPLKELYGRTAAAEFGPRALKAVRQKMIAADLARTTINGYVNRLRHIVKWATENELLAPSVLHGLQSVAPLRFGRTDARESEPIKPVPEAFVEDVLPHVAPQVAAMIKLQTITGMRSGEVTAMRACDISMAGKVWTYTPEQHKTAYRGHARTIYLGPKAQAIVKPFLVADTTAYLFNPADAYESRIASWYLKSRPGRKTKVYPCELRRRKARSEARRRKQKSNGRGERYTTNSYRRAIERGVEQANKARIAEANEAGINPDDVDLIPHWHPHQLRHNAATNLRREHGIEIARIILGHRSAAITEVYAEVDHARAIELMAKIG